MPLRPASSGLAGILSNNLNTALAEIAQADLFTIVLLSGTTLTYTSWPTDLTVGAAIYTSAVPWLTRGRWNVTNTMEIPTLEIFIDADNSSFSGGPNIKTQIHNGMLDGASVLLQRLYMPTPGVVDVNNVVSIFSGDAGSATIGPIRTTLKVRGKNSRLSVQAPRNVYQPGCIHTFCDEGCTLSAGSFSAGHTVAASPAPTRIAVTSATIIPTQARGGTLTMTSGAAVGEVRSIVQGGPLVGPWVLQLAYPLTVAPAVGDTFTLFQDCDKTFGTCDATYSNKVNFRGFPFIPPPAISQGKTTV
jgi:uncharacterized phage protein (TIGR02218 family)